MASFLWPRKTCSSSFRFRMSKSLQRWSRDAVSSQLPLRLSFTSMTVFLWAWLQTEHQDSSLWEPKVNIKQRWPFVLRSTGAQVGKTCLGEEKHGTWQEHSYRNGSTTGMPTIKAQASPASEGSSRSATRQKGSLKQGKHLNKQTNIQQGSLYLGKSMKFLSLRQRIEMTTA